MTARRLGLRMPRTTAGGARARGMPCGILAVGGSCLAARGRRAGEIDACVGPGRRIGQTPSRDEFFRNSLEVKLYFLWPTDGSRPEAFVRRRRGRRREGGGMPSFARLSISALWSVITHMFATAGDAHNVNVLIEGLSLAVMGLAILATRSPDSRIRLFFISDSGAQSVPSRRSRGRLEKSGRRMTPSPSVVAFRPRFLHERQDFPPPPPP